MSKQIIFFRHFDKLYNNRYRFDETLKNIKIDKNIDKMHDSPLSKDKLPKDKFVFEKDICYVSPYLRTRQTYDYLFGDKNYFIDSRIREYLGHSANRGNSLDVEDKTSEYVNDVPGEESEDDFEKRCNNFFDEIMKNSHEKIFVVTHGFVINKFFKYAKLNTIRIDEGGHYVYNI
jgi:broad specificity phosphatase PhoE